MQRAQTVAGIAVIGIAALSLLVEQLVNANGCATERRRFGDGLGVLRRAMPTGRAAGG